MSDDAIPERPQGLPETLWEDIFPPDRKAILESASRYFVRGYGRVESLEKALIDADDMSFMSGRHYEIYLVLGPVMGCNPELLPFPHVRAACEAVTNTADIFWQDIIKSENPVRSAFQKRLWWRPQGGCLICGYPVSEGSEKSRLKFSRIDGDSDFIHDTCAEGFKFVGKVFGELVLKESLAIQGKRFRAEPVSSEGLEVEDNGWDDDGYWSERGDD